MIREADAEWAEFHGSEKVEGGKLTGQTDTDYFYFLCPQCPDKQVMRVLDAIQLFDNHNGQRLEKIRQYESMLKSKRRVKSEITIAFKIYCEECKLTDHVKITNGGLQTGQPLCSAADTTPSL